MDVDKKTLERMMEGDLKWEELKPIISGRKDQNRFDKVERKNTPPSSRTPLHRSKRR